MATPLHQERDALKNVLQGLRGEHENDEERRVEPKPNRDFYAVSLIDAFSQPSDLGCIPASVEDVQVKLQYSLRFFLLSSSLLGLVAVFLAKYFLFEPPIAINTVVYGHTTNTPPKSIELDLLDVQRAVGGDCRNGDWQFAREIVSVISERV